MKRPSPRVIGVIVAINLLMLAVVAYAASGALSLSGYVSGLSDGAVTIGPVRITSSSAVYQRTTPSLSSGDNTVSVPTGATCCMVIFPAANAQTVKIKGAAGDTGVSLLATGKNVVQLAAAQTSFIINAGGTVTGTIVIFF